MLSWAMLSRFHLIPERHGQTADGREINSKVRWKFCCHATSPKVTRC